MLSLRSLMMPFRFKILLYYSFRIIIIHRVALTIPVSYSLLQLPLKHPSPMNYSSTKCLVNSLITYFLTTSSSSGIRFLNLTCPAAEETNETSILERLHDQLDNPYTFHFVCPCNACTSLSLCNDFILLWQPVQVISWPSVLYVIIVLPLICYI